MPTHDRLRSKLLAIFEMKYRRQGRTLGELAQNIGVAPSYISKFLNGKLASPSEKLLARIEDFVDSKRLTSSDERLMMEVLKLLSHADDASSILAALHLSGR